jgi:hypothetical protein
MRGNVQGDRSQILQSPRLPQDDRWRGRLRLSGELFISHAVRRSVGNDNHNATIRRCGEHT